MNFRQWQIIYGVSDAAIQALVQMSVVESTAYPDMSEAGVDSRIRLEAAEHGVHLWRNNRGAGKVQYTDEETGEVKTSRFMRWGLANDSKEMAADMRSHDRIGIRKTLITQEMVGTYIGRLYSREIKAGSWKWTGTEHEMGQLAWGTLINSQGGDAKIVNGPGSFA